MEMAKNLSTHTVLKDLLWIDVSGTRCREIVEQRYHIYSAFGNWGVFHPIKLMEDEPGFIWGMVLQCNMKKGVSEIHPWGESHPWSYIKLLETFAPEFDWSGADFEEERLRNHERVQYGA